MIKRTAMALQTAYADLVDKCMDDEFLDNLKIEEGKYTTKTIKGKEYWYFQYPDKETGKWKQKYMGRETPELRDKIDKSNELKEARAHRRDIVRSLIRGGSGVAPTRQMGPIIAKLNEAGVFRLRSVLVGTLAYQTYGPMLGVRLGSSALQTEDIDIAQFQSISIAVGDEINTDTMLEKLQEYDEKFTPVSKPLHEKDPISYKSGNIRLEFLTPNRGPDSDTPAKLEAIKTSAQPLRFLDFLIYNEIKSVVLEGAGVLVNVPDPTRYALHKLIVAQRRDKRNRAKINKDLIQAQSLLEVLIEDRPYDVKDFWEELKSRGPKWETAAKASLELINPTVKTKFYELVDEQKVEAELVSASIPTPK
jgi:hypothetical protein